jgi:hypothetical protein
MNRIIAGKVQSPSGKDLMPDPAEWERVIPVSFCSDWCGENADPRRETQVRLLWSRDHLFLRFHCRYRDFNVYESKNSRCDQLWLRDVAEVFVRPGKDDPRHYKEFEISPNGNWLDLDICRGEKSILFCDLRSRVVINHNDFVWTAEMAIPMHCMTASFNPDEIWRLNLFRIEGREPERFYSAWQPTCTPKPNFHVPECFGELMFRK